MTGTVGRNVEVNDDELNFVASDELNPQKARILLMLALLKPRSTAEIQNLFWPRSRARIGGNPDGVKQIQWAIEVRARCLLRYSQYVTYTNAPPWPDPVSNCS